MKDLNALEVLQLLKPTAFSSATTVLGSAVDISQLQADGHAMIAANTTADTGTGNTITVQLESSATSGGTYTNLGTAIVLTTAGGAGVFTGPVDLRESLRFIKASLTSTDASSLVQTVSVELIVLPKVA